MRSLVAAKKRPVYSLVGPLRNSESLSFLSSSDPIFDDTTASVEKSRHFRPAVGTGAAAWEEAAAAAAAASAAGGEAGIYSRSSRPVTSESFSLAFFFAIRRLVSKAILEIASVKDSISFSSSPGADEEAEDEDAEAAEDEEEEDEEDEDEEEAE